jgi:hypothetical protein
MSRRYALFDAGNKGASLAVENGGVLLTTTAAGLSIARSCRSTLAQDEDDSSVEFILFSTSAIAPSIANKVSIGLCTAAASMSAYIGADGESIGYRPAEGQIHTGGASVQSVATSGLGSAIGVTVSFGEFPMAAWYVDGALIGTQAIPAGMVGEDIYFAVSLGSDAAAGDIRVKVTTGDGTNGSQLVEFPLAGFTGWWTPYALPEAVRIATVDYLSHHDDDIPSTRWHGGVTGRSGGERRGYSVWPWGQEHQVQAAIMEVEFTDPDGLLDVLLSPAYRYQPVSVQYVEHDAPLSEVLETQTWYFDRCEVRDDLTKVVYLRDIISLLELPLQRRAFRPDVDPQAANRWMPTLIGVAGSIPVTLVDGDVSSSPEPTFQIAAADVEQIGKVREAGVPLDSATDFTLLAGGQQIQLAASPDEGEITLDAARTGPGYIPAAPVDAMGGIGNPFADGGGGDIVGWGRFQDGASLGDNMPYYYGSGQVAFPQGSSAFAHITPTSASHQLVLGQRYRYSFTVVDLIERGNRDAEIGLSYSEDRFGAIESIRSTRFYDGNPDGDPRTYSGTFVSLQTVKPSFFYYGMEDNAPGRPGRIRDFTLIELPNINDTGDDEAVEDALPKMGLEDAARMIIETESGLTSEVWDASSAAAIDTETGYEGGGIYSEEQWSRREALERLLPGWGAGLYKTRAGKAAFLRMPIPEEEIGSDPIIITGDDLLDELVVVRDGGQGLTRQLGVRKNYRILTAAEVDKVALNLTQRARLARPHRYTLATGAPFAPGYEHADGAEVLDTPLWMPEDGQAEIDFWGRYYSIGRAFYLARMPFRSDIDIGTVLLLQYPRYGMSAGIPVFAVPLEEDRINDEFRSIMFCGAAPYEDF